MCTKPVDSPGNALSSDLPDLIHLWSLCFQETEAESAYFLTHRFFPEQTFVWRREGKVCAMIFLIPVQNGNYPGGYLYAIGTHPALRGQGIFSRLHQYVKELAAAAGLDFLCLIPAEASLFSLYGRLGYETWYGRQEFSLSELALPPASVSTKDCTPEEFLSCMDTVFPVSVSCPKAPPGQKLCTRSPSSLLTCQTESDRLLVLRQHLHYEGFLKRCTADHTGFVLAGSVEGDALYLSQSSCSLSGLLLQAGAALAREHSCSRLYLPPAGLKPSAFENTCFLSGKEAPSQAQMPSFKAKTAVTPYAMGLWLTQKHRQQPAPNLGLMYT